MLHHQLQPLRPVIPIHIQSIREFDSVLRLHTHGIVMVEVAKRDRFPAWAVVRADIQLQMTFAEHAHGSYIELAIEEWFGKPLSPRPRITQRMSNFQGEFSGAELA